MKIRTFLFFGFIAFFSQTAYLQETKELTIIGKAKKLDDELIARKDQNGNYCAAIQVISDMDGFSYDSNNGIVGNIDDSPGKDIVYLTASERVLEMFKTGYKPLQIILSEQGIILKPREIWQIEIAGEEILNKIPVTILYTPADAIIMIDNQSVSGITHILTLGVHTLHIEKTGYQTIDKEITVSEQHVFFDENLELVKKVPLQIETIPSGAIIYLDDVRIGETPFSKFYPPGNYPIQIIKEGFVTVDEYLQVSAPQTNKSYNLEENAGYITINTNPSAQVYFNDKPIPNPKKVKLIPQLLKIKVTQPKAEPLEQEITLKRKDDLVLDMYPVAQTGTIQIAVTPFNAKAELTGDAGEKFSSNGSKEFENVPIGTYNLIINLQGYKSFLETLTLKAGETLERSIKLVVEETPQPGTIQITVTPFSAKVELTSDSWKKYSSVGSKKFENIPVGTYKLNVSLQGYESHKETLTLKAGEALERSIKLNVEETSYKPKKEFTLFDNLSDQRSVTSNNKHHETRITFGPYGAFTSTWLLLKKNDSIHDVDGLGFEVGFRSEFWGNKYCYFTIESNFSKRRLTNYQGGTNQSVLISDDRFQFIGLNLIADFFGAIELGYSQNFVIKAKDNDGQDIMNQIKSNQKEIITGLYFSRKKKNRIGAAVGLRAYWGLNNISDTIERLNYKSLVTNYWISIIF